MIKLSVEVHCLEPLTVWGKSLPEQRNLSKYRIYIDDDLITERDWIWDQETYICENMIAEISADTTHTVWIDVLNFYSGYKIKLGLDKLIVNDVLYEIDDYKDKISFIIA